MSLGPSMIERMGANQRTIGLKPIGLHRPTADRLLRSLSQRCRHCAGEGFRPVGTCWLWCEGCDGLGRVITPKARFTLRRQVTMRYPAAAIDGLTLVAGYEACRGSAVFAVPRTRGAPLRVGR